jgi:murein DD-endopeptidase MepM/ murein hydrolase activator NlpD
VVKAAGRDGGYGLRIIIDHGYGIETLYGHCSKLEAKVGQKVERGDVIARVGDTGTSTGPHVHYEVRLNGEPVDPASYLPD